MCAMSTWLHKFMVLWLTVKAIMVVEQVYLKEGARKRLAKHNTSSIRGLSWSPDRFVLAVEAFLLRD